MQNSESRLFQFRSEFVAAVVEVIARSRCTLCILDRNLADWPLESPAVVADLQRVLGDPAGSIRIVVHETGHLERSAPRLAQLRRLHGDRLLVRQAPPTLPAGESLLLGDASHVLRRAHHEAFRGRVELALPQQVDPWRLKFEALWGESIACLSLTTLGL